MNFKLTKKEIIGIIISIGVMFIFTGCSSSKISISDWMQGMFTNQPTKSETTTNKLHPKTKKIKPITLNENSHIKTFDIYIDSNHNSDIDVQNLFKKQAEDINNYLASIKNLNQYTPQIEVTTMGGYSYNVGGTHQIATVTLNRKNHADQIKPANHKQVIYTSFSNRLNDSYVKSGLKSQDNKINQYLNSIKNPQQYQIKTQSNNISSYKMGTFHVVSVTLIKK